MINRQEYLDKLISLKDKQIIKIVTGIRRCGKSTLFDIFEDYLLHSGVMENQIIRINFEESAEEPAFVPASVPAAPAAAPG